MNPFDELKGNAALKHCLQNALGERFPQTILLSGDSPKELETASKALAAGILCDSSGARPCGECLSCRKVMQGIHPDFMIIDEGDNELKVEFARRVKDENSLVPNDGPRRVTLIRHAQNLNTSAQNALLKELEEPPGFAFFILTAERPDALLETVRSRCAKFALEPARQSVDDSEAAKLLAPYLSAIAAGREDQMMRSALALEKTPRRELLGVLDVLKAALRDAVFISENLAQPPLQPMLSKESRALAAKVTSGRLIEFYRFLFTLSDRISRNAAAAAVTCALTSDAYHICFLSH